MKPKYLIVVCGILLGLAGPALAQVPVSDAGRLRDETGIANCMAKARATQESTVQPTRDIHASVSTPGTAGQAAQVGTDNLTGATAASGSAGGSAGGVTPPSVANVGVNGTVNGIDLSGVMQTAGSIGALKAKNLAQTLSSLSAATTAIEGNQSNWQGISGAIGSDNTIQGAFDQNSGTRIGSAAAWNQAVEVGNVGLGLQNQRLTDKAAGAAATSKTMTYDPAQAGFVAPAAETPDNQRAVKTTPTTYGTVAAQLSRAQTAAQANDSVTGSIFGQ